MYIDSWLLSLPWWDMWYFKEGARDKVRCHLGKTDLAGGPWIA